MNKPIFPKNWDKKKEKLAFWKKPEIQKAICPKCHYYGQRFPYDKVCQFCGYDARPEPEPEPLFTQEYIGKKANKMIEVVLTGGDVKDFVCSFIKEVREILEQ